MMKVVPGRSKKEVSDGYLGIGSATIHHTPYTYIHTYSAVSTSMSSSKACYYHWRPHHRKPGSGIVGPHVSIPDSTLSHSHSPVPKPWLR